MNETLIKNWNACVRPGDLVYHLGDVGFGQAQHMANIVRRLNGTKRLIIGNHDHKNLKDPTFSNCFDWAKDYYELNEGEKRYILFHYPIDSWNGKNHNSIHLFGHKHQKEDTYKELKMEVGVDRDIAGYTPISLDTINSIMETKKQKMKENK